MASLTDHAMADLLEYAAQTVREIQDEDDPMASFSGALAVVLWLGVVQKKLLSADEVYKALLANMISLRALPNPGGSSTT